MMMRTAPLAARGIGVVAIALGALLGGGTGHADSILFEVSIGAFVHDGDAIPGLSASALFEFDSFVSQTLTVTLTNTSPYDVVRPEEVLTALLFTIDGDATLGREDAMLNEGSAVEFWVGTEDWFDENPNADRTSSDGTYGLLGDVGAEWAYINDIGISSTGLDDTFGPGDRFDQGPGRDLWDPDSPDGLQYGILPAADDTTFGNQAVTGNQPLILDSVVFTFTASQGFSLSDISNVSFQYGTSWDGPNVPIPEPASVVLLGIGVTLAMLRKRNRQSR